MNPNDLTAADFAATAGHVATLAMEADVLWTAEIAPAPASPEVQAVLDARAELAVAEALHRAASTAFRRSPTFGTMDAQNSAGAALGAASKVLRVLEAATYVPGATKEEDRRAFWARHQQLENEITGARISLEAAQKRGQATAAARHTVTIARLKAELAAFDADYGQVSDSD